MKKCPSCAEEIQDEAIKCKHCGELIYQARLSAKPPKKKNKIKIIILYTAGLFCLLMWFGHCSADKNTKINSTSGLQSPTQEHFIIDVSFKNFNAQFGLNSKLTDLQKDEIFKTIYKDKTIRWRGQVTSVDKTLGDIQVQVKHLPSTFVSDVILTLKDSENNKAMQIHKGDIITYIGVLKDWGAILAHPVSDGVIVAINDKQI